MRLEYNYINWPRIQKQLDEVGRGVCAVYALYETVWIFTGSPNEVKWMSAEARDSQAVKDSKAAICRAAQDSRVKDLQLT